jgi:hypothetical protein
MGPFGQLISYIAPAAPATRRPASGDEAFVRPEVGFTPNWYREALGLDFGQRWHCDPAYRRETVLAMRAELRRRFPGTKIGGIDRPDRPLDLVTGIHGGCTVAGIFGVPILYAANNWPSCAHRYLSDAEVDRIEPPDLDASPLFQDLLAQLDWIGEHEGRIEGFINWQGVLNTAHRLRGEELFYDLTDNPGRCRRLFECVATVMADAATRLQRRQAASGVKVGFITVSNCLVNMIAPQCYREFLLPLDRRLAETFGCIGVHNCAWTADPYMADYATIPGLAYVDMGLHSDLSAARRTIPHARRAVMYTPMDLAGKPLAEIRRDLERIAADYAPCDVVVADIESGTPDERVREFLALCAGLPNGS